MLPITSRLRGHPSANVRNSQIKSSIICFDEAADV